MPKKLTYEEVKNYIEVESDSGCKLLSEEYESNRIKLKLKCSCGNEFEATFNKFKQCNKRRCNSCSNQEYWSIEKAKSILSKDGYFMLKKPENINANTKIEVICPKNHCFITDMHHFSSHKTRCPYCNGGVVKDKITFLKQVIDLVGKNYEILDNYINAYTKIRFLHKECNKISLISPSSFVNQGTRCLHCFSPRNSKGQKIINEFILNNNITFSTEQTFKECKDKQLLQYDFYINNKVLIEFDGQQHFEPVKFGGKNDNKAEEMYIINQKHDQIKNTYCIENNIPLIRIPYWEKDNIEYILENVLIHFNLINNENDTYDKEIVNKYLVDSKWNHDTYLSWNDKDKRDILMKRELIHN